MPPNLTYYLENEPVTFLFAVKHKFSLFAGVQAHEKFIKNADDIFTSAITRNTLLKHLNTKNLSQFIGFFYR
jgi:hypothetical protein